jgi:hypothetical protein
MTREEEIKQAAEKELKDCPYINTSLIGFDFFIKGAQWADSHPHWKSVEDEMPPRWETNPNVSDTVITYGFLGDTQPIVELNHYHFGDKRWFYSQATHWMPFEHPKKGGEK